MKFVNYLLIEKQQMEFFRDYIYPAIILFLAFVVRFNSAFFAYGNGYTTDSYTYISQAEHILKGGYALYFPNGYPLIISLFLPFKSYIDLTTTLLLLNVILSTLTVFLIYKICKNSFKEHIIALVAITVIAFYPNQIKYVHWILTEVPAAFFLVLSLYLFTKEKNMLAGFSIGFASMIRTVLLPVGILFILFLIVKKRSAVFKFSVMFASVIFLFMTYGYIKKGVFTIGQNSRHNLSITAEYTDSAGFPDVKLKNFEGSLNDYVAYMTDDSEKYVKDRVKNLVGLWSPLPVINDYNQNDFKYFMKIGLRFPLLILALFGFFTFKKNPVIVFSIITIAAVSFIHFFYFASYRFTYTAEPLAVILASAGVYNIYQKLIKPKFSGKIRNSF